MMFILVFDNTKICHVIVNSIKFLKNKFNKTLQNF
jgi:hypothetical protein